MIRALLTTTALTAVLVTGAIAQEATTAGPSGNSQLLTEGYQIVDTDGLALSASLSIRRQPLMLKESARSTIWWLARMGRSPL
jgi:hypothetical protein